MKPPEYTFDETRLAALADLNVLDTPAEPGFDDIVELAAQVCEAPVALVSLVAGDRQWFKARIGFDRSETDLDSSVCAHALVEQDLLIIPDLARDPRTMANPLVAGEPHIRFYAGAPLRTAAGQVLGSLCVIDGVPREGGLTPAQASGLRNLARQVMSQLELRQALADRDLLLAEQQRASRRRTGLLRLGDELRDLNTVADMTRAASAIVGQALDVGRAAFGRLDPDGEYIDVEPDWTVDGMASIAGRHRFADYGGLTEELVRGEALVVDDVLIDSRTAAAPERLIGLGVRSLVNVPVRDGGRTVAVLLVHDSQPRGWSPEVLAFLRNAADRVEVALARHRAAAEQRVLNQELSHRMKNTMAMVQAIAIQSLKAVPDQVPVRVFEKRIHALSTAHDVLLLQSWTGARMEAVVQAVLALSQPERFDVSGPSVDLSARATLSLSMLLHELATNAFKYGALSAENGRVVITWRIDGAGSEPELSLHWREVGGPASIGPRRTGFGSRLIGMGLLGTGGVDLRYLSSGFEADFKAPLAHLQLS